MKFLFLGAGAIGTYVGGSLAASGHQVAFIEQPGPRATIAEAGLQVTKAGTTQAVRNVTLFDNPTDALAAGPYDVAVMALKSMHTAGAVDDLVATGHEVPSILSLQNGVENEPTIAERVGADRVIAGTVTSAIAKPGVGQVIEEKHRGIGIAVGHRLSMSLVDALDRAGLGAKGYPEAGPMKWSKLLTNLQGNALSAIVDMPVGDLFADRQLYEIEIAALRECLNVMASLGYRPIDLPGTPVRALALAASRLPRFIAQPALTRALGASRGDKMPSFHIDLHLGVRTEVHYLNGAVVRFGEAHGVPTPVNRVLTDTLEGLSSGTLAVDDFRRNPDALLRLLA